MSEGLKWRDAAGTALVVFAIAVAASVVYGWHWPLVADARAGVIALFILSYPSCLVAQAPRRMASAMRHETSWSPFVLVATVLGALAVLLMIANLLLNSAAVLVGMTIVVAAIWVVTTAHRVQESASRPLRSART
jgi:hypothetical protein